MVKIISENIMGKIIIEVSLSSINTQSVKPRARMSLPLKNLIPIANYNFLVKHFRNSESRAAPL
jgi:hypothetical protein